MSPLRSATALHNSNGFENAVVSLVEFSHAYSDLLGNVFGLILFKLSVFAIVKLVERNAHQ